ncbi:hypothetical protein SteCoe_19713 [Stentor coeruleus]|uniref:Uncharacterized protein n=1 Tax=Stentor coeruleus TaxID=5963 RepID=A0A1R2BU56_9CILI|nr:hypothetical protein SteCoe_19713 [Stentor coeruleus]
MLYLVSQGFFPLALHNMLLFINFLPCTFFGLSILIHIYKKSISQINIERFYKSLVLSGSTWLLEFWMMVGISSELNSGTMELLLYAFPSMYCILQDYYFAYCIYACKVYIETGRIREIFPISPSPSVILPIPIANEHKVVTAFPEIQPPPMNKMISVLDFTLGPVTEI